MKRLAWALALAAAGTPLSAQVPGDSIQIIAERGFTDTAQSARVTLFKSVVYQLELSQSGVTPRFVPLRRGTYPPTALRVQTSGPLGGPVFEVHVDRDGEYDLSLVGLNGTNEVRMRLHTDPATTLHPRIKLDAPSWRLGLRAEVGVHSGYRTSAQTVNPRSGMYFGGCVVIAYGSQPVSALGAGPTVVGMRISGWRGSLRRGR